MIREYKTVEEIVSPLMMVRDVEGVTYDELVEVQLHDGSVRRGKVLEVNGDTAVVQLFDIRARESIGRAKSVPADEYQAVYETIRQEMAAQIEAVAAQGGEQA